MAASPLSQQDYEALRNRLIEKAENESLAGGTAQPPTVVGSHLTLGFGYDLRTRKDRPGEILTDLARAEVELTVMQTAAIMFYCGWSHEQIWNYLAGLSDMGATVTVGDRDFVQKLGPADRTDDGMRDRLFALELTITKAQGEALLAIVASEKEKEFDDILRSHVADEGLRGQLAAPTAERAVLVDMLYQSAGLLGEHLLSALEAGDDAAAALEIAFLSNRTPRETPGIDARNRARAETFLGRALAPRTKAEAGAFLHAIAGRADALARALHNREGRQDLQPYQQNLQALIKASLAPFGLDDVLELQSDGRFHVTKEVPLDDLARSFGLSPRELALANPDIFPTPPDGPAMFPKGKTLHLPARRAPPRRGHASLGGDELPAPLSPAALAALDADAWRIGPELELAAARYGLSELAALPALNPGVDLPALGASLGFGGVAERTGCRLSCCPSRRTLTASRRISR